MAFAASMGPASASETTIYRYDALGRLIQARVTGGPNTNKVTSTCFDPAGNRSRYGVAAAAPPCAQMPTNQAPVANADSFNAACYQTGSANLIANDVDPDGEPLALQSISKVDGAATAEVTSDSTVAVETGDAGISTFSYVVSDGEGQMASGTLTVTSTQPEGGCEAAAGVDAAKGGSNGSEGKFGADGSAVGKPSGGAAGR